MKYIYLDYAATTPTDPRVVKAMKPYFRRFFGNPSSLHETGQEARRIVKKSREQIAHFINAEPEEIIFTAGGSEANNLALKGVFYQTDVKFPHFIASQIEHHAILEPCNFLKKQGAEITFLPVDKSGLVDLEVLKKSIKDTTIMVSIMHANNEIGTIQPLKEIGEIIQQEKQKRKNNNISVPLYFHTDAVQTFGHLPINVKDLPVDFLSASSHKIYGPKGVGLLYVRNGIKIEPLIHGGEHEQGRRASTENVSGIVGFAKAVELAEKEMVQEAEQLIGLRDYLIAEILNKIEKSHLNGHQKKRLPNNVNVSIEGIEGESMLIELDYFGVACSTGSACSSEELKPSHVLSAMNLSPEIAHASLRFSLGKWTKKKDLDYLVEKLILVVNRLRGISPLKVSDKN